MRRLLLITLFSFGMIAARGQITISADWLRWINGICTPYSVTVDLSSEKISLINFGKEGTIERPIITIYYPISRFNISKEAIEKHLQEKGMSE